MAQTTVNKRAGGNGKASTLDTLPAALVQQFAEMVRTMPRLDADGGAAILEQILNAASPEAINAIFDDEANKEPVGVEIVIESAEVGESDFEDGLGVFLLVKAIRTDTGEAIRFTTGARSVVATIAWAWANNKLPMAAVVTQTALKDNKTAKQLRIVRTNV